MSDKLIKFLKERIDTQVEDNLSCDKIESLPLQAYEKGFTNGYIIAIDYINTLLRLENIIDFKQSKELSDYIQTALDKTLTSRSLK
jgi:hypothetical protein